MRDICEELAVSSNATFVRENDAANSFQLWKKQKDSVTIYQNIIEKKNHRMNSGQSFGTDANVPNGSVS